MRLILIVVCCMLTLSGCLGEKSQWLDSSKLSSPAVLTGYRFDQNFVHIDVVSNGCTFMTSFKLLLASKEDNSIKVVRVKPDNCKMKPRKLSLNYTYSHLGLDTNRPIYMAN